MAGKERQAKDGSQGLALLPFFMVFGGCMSAVIAMEYVLKANPKAGNLLSLSEFAFVLIQSMPSRVESKSGSVGLRPLLMPLSSHVKHAALWVSMSVLANVAFGFNISVPIHTLFRSCNVIASVLLGYALFGQRYSFKQLLCVLVITVGIFLGSVGDAKQFFGSCVGCGGGSKPAADGSSDAGFLRWITGIVLLLFVQLLQGFLGHTQALLYKRHSDCGKKGDLSEEFLFTSHLVSFLPFVFLWEDVMAAARFALATPPLSEALPVPSQFLFLLLNNIFQLICIKGVFRLSAHYSPLTVNITLSVRKFLSVVVSILWFGNTWTTLHSIATVAIFGGVFAYSQCSSPPPVPEKDTKKEK
eukprot:TRINITY_DN83165_c0_g1_i1.p1 TRINITY_DN83165_c0_g1~~TRINITY_DN83165_c0_g1_i1.p1  ORF type:complete len:358 (+),score=76.39 TRINITY_DN83165_c0_g1_i1:42-1115(+)